jgi:hypothetical protein
VWNIEICAGIFGETFSADSYGTKEAWLSEKLGTDKCMYVATAIA